MIRSVLAFVVGFLMIAVAGALLDAVSDPYRRAAPTVGVVVALLYFAPSIAGGYLAALIGRRRPVTHAAAVAAFIGITGVIYLIVEVPKELVWFELLKFGVVVPGALLGGYLRSRAPSPIGAPRQLVKNGN